MNRFYAVVKCTLPQFVLYASLILQLISCQEPSEDKGWPTVMDDRIQLDLIDQDPNIMTPIGLAIDQADRIYVLESHTHHPPKDYSGPAFDRIKIGVDENQDGRPESWEIFADSITDGMNLTCGPENTLYLACKDRVLAFRDADRDGKSERADTLLIMRAGGDIYDHAGILGVTLSPDGWIFISRGNTGGLEWEMTGADGSTVSGYGDGGNVVRMTPQGGQLEEVATGFWNPFGIHYTADHRLVVTDNDPDSRGPNRLVEIVYGGDYGYRSLYGGSGIHPFLAWNGELPGTLPYAVALGEAPCGLIDARFTNFGADYQQTLLASIWEENSIVRIPLRDRGSSISGATEVLVKGDSTFHPVAFAVNSKGELYFTDWVVRQYPNHQKGRLWRLSSSGSSPAAEETIADAPANSKGGNWLNRNLSAGDPQALIAALSGSDNFTQAVARKYLSHPSHRDVVFGLLTAPEPGLRLQGLLTLFHNDLQPESSMLAALLRDEDEKIRQSCLKYIALKSRRDLYASVEKSLPEGYISPALFESYLATIRHLQPDFVEKYRNKSERQAKQLPRNLPPGFLLSLLRDDALPETIRAEVIPQLNFQEVDPITLLDLLETGELPVQTALLQVYTRRPQAEIIPALLQIAKNPGADPQLRTLALLSLSYQPGSFCQEVMGLLPSSTAAMEQVALRYLCRCREEGEIQTAVRVFLGNEAPETSSAIWQQCSSGAVATDRPADPESWQKIIDGQGNPELGKWVFHSRKAQCQNCHRIDRWGSDFGPDLSHIGSSKSKTQLLTAILEPSAEISPEWQGWYITDREGNTHYGRQIDVGFKNAELLLASGEFVTYQEPQSYGMSTTSLMPENLYEQLTVAEVNDLIAYLISLK